MDTNNPRIALANARITSGMKLRMGDKRHAARAHAEANPRQNYSRPKTDRPRT